MGEAGREQGEGRQGRRQGRRHRRNTAQQQLKSSTGATGLPLLAARLVTSSLLRNPCRRADALTFTDIAKEAATGKAYLHTHLDNAARPVIIVRCAKHLTNASPLLESQRLCVHICDRAVERLSPEQQTMLGIFDLRGFTSKNADLGFVRFLVDIFFTYYPKRLSQVLFVEAPWAFKPGWEMIKPVRVMKIK